MNKKWDAFASRDAFISFLTEAFTEVLRVTKPGGHALVWALPRTSHWTATALENAGWECRDVMHHISSKDHDVSAFLHSLSPEQEIAFAKLLESSPSVFYHLFGQGFPKSFDVSKGIEKEIIKQIEALGEEFTGWCDVS